MVELLRVPSGAQQPPAMLWQPESQLCAWVFKATCGELMKAHVLVGASGKLPRMSEPPKLGSHCHCVAAFAWGYSSRITA